MGGSSGLARPGPGLVISGIAACLVLLIGAAGIFNGMAAWSLRKGDPAAALEWSPDSAAALSASAEAHYRAGRDDEALRSARASLARSPYDVRALRVIGLVEGRPDLDRRRQVMRQASRLSRRDSAVSSWLLRDALANGDAKGAALEADILLRRRVQVDGSVFRILHEVIQTPAGQAAAAERLKLRPPWREPFLGGAGLTADPTAVSQLLARLREVGGAPTDDEAHPLFRRLVVQRRYDEARLARTRIFGAKADVAGLVYDPDLNGLPGPPPLNWEPLSASGASYNWKAASATTGQLRLDWAPTISSPVLRQLIFLKPGRYAAQVTALNAEMDADQAFTLEVQCDSRTVVTRMPIRTSSAGPEVTRGDFLVPAEACEAQWLQIRASPDTLREVSIILDRIDVSRAQSRQGGAGE